VVIRPLERSDLAAVLAMWERLVENGRRADPRFVLRPDGREAMASLAGSSWLVRRPWPGCLVAEADRLVGFITLYPTNPSPVIEAPPGVLIGDVWVEADWRGTGLGRRLVDEGIEAARRGGCERIEVGTLTRDGAALAFWKHLGFQDWRVTLAL
jgi:GNAT superfamily N-acetyltransferase